MSRAQQQYQQRQLANQGSEPAAILAFKEIDTHQKEFEERASIHKKVKFSQEVEFAKNLVLSSRPENTPGQFQKDSFGLYLCTPQSIYTAILNVASLGLTLNPIHKLAYLVPRRNKVTGFVECYLEPSYIGMSAVLVDSGMAKGVYAERVFLQDIDEGRFKYFGQDQRPFYEGNPLDRRRTQFTSEGAIAWVELADGGYYCDYMNRLELDNAKAASFQQNNWVKFPDEYERKSAIRRLFKKIPKPLDNVMVSAADQVLSDLDNGYDGEGMTEVQGHGSNVIEHDSLDTVSGVVVHNRGMESFFDC